MSKELKTELLRFFKGHWPMLLVAPPMAVFFTLLHEAAHAFAVIVQGGTLTEFVWLPTSRGWGHINYKFPMDVEFSSRAISIAPYFMWVLFSCAAALLSLRKRAWPFWFAATVFVWMYAAPLMDIAHNGIPYLSGSNNDFANAFGPPGFGMWAGFAVTAIFCAIGGFAVQTRLYRERALSAKAYIILFCAASTFLLVVS
ncbi:MAG: hypothetical protein ACYS8Z_10925 [Planctomycetota bacterium]|jgi:hypothetical protein